MFPPSPLPLEKSLYTFFRSFFIITEALFTTHKATQKKFFDSTVEDVPQR